MKEPRLAEAYCDRMYEAAAKEKGQSSSNQMAAWSGLAAQHNYDMYLALIQVGHRAMPCKASFSLSVSCRLLLALC